MLIVASSARASAYAASVATRPSSADSPSRWPQAVWTASQ